MASPSDPLENLRIQKNAYFFDLRRRFSPVGHYMIKKSKSLNPLVQMFGGPQRPKMPVRPGGAKKIEEEEKSTGPSFVSAILKTIVLFMVIAVLAGVVGWVWLNASIPKAEPQPPEPKLGFVGGLELRPLILDFLTSGSRTDTKWQGYAQFDYTARNLSQLKVDARIYASAPARQVFLLQYPRIGDRDYAAFRASLEENLRRQGWPLADIRLADLNDMPSGSILIIPTGFIPISLVEDNGLSPDIMELATRGISIIYIGQPLDQALNAAGKPIPSPAGAMNRMGLNFDTLRRPTTSAPFHLGAPLYTVSAKKGTPILYYGSVSSLQIGRGFVLFVPQTLDGGWPQGGTQAGEDIAMLAAEEPYRPVLSTSAWQSGTDMPQRGRVTLFFDPAIDKKEGTLRLRFYLNDSGGFVEQLVVDWPIFKTSTGEMYVDSGNVMVPKYLGGGTKAIDLQPDDPAGRETNLYLELEKDSQSIDRVPVSLGPLFTNVRTTGYFDTNAPTGSYVLRLVDGYNHIYAATRIWVPNLDVIGPNADYEPFRLKKYNEKVAFNKGEFAFVFFSDGQPRQVPEVNVSMSGPIASMNGQTKTFNDLDTITYQFKRDFVRGNYTFNFDFGHDYKKSVTLTYWYRIQPWERQDVQIMAIISAIIFGVGFYVSKLRSDKPTLALDIPDFPPQSVLKISVTPKQVLNLFEQLNKDYAWEHMPLKEDELRNGFRKIISGGKPVMIGDYNLTRIMMQMRERKLAVEELGYWMPASWIVDSQTPARRLAVYRHLRDLFVTNAIRFSRLRAVPTCDVKAIIGSSEYFIHIYEGTQEVIVRALGTADLGQTWIIFKDGDERERFEERLHSAAQAQLALKLQIANRRVKMVCLDELPNIIKSIR